MLVENTLVSPLPGLGTLKSVNSDAYGGLSVGDPYPGCQTPTSSADPASERIDPVLLLSRPVEGFNHPRQHVFTDRLLGRFYEDSSLDAETRKTSKCLAGRLGTAGSHSTTRPSTTATTNSHFRRSRSPTTTRRGGKRMHGSASARALGSSREPAVGLAGRKEQIQKEILEQKALIERLEGRVASLSGRGRRSSAPRGSSAPPQEDRQRGASGRTQDADERPTTTPQSESAAVQERRGAEYEGDGHGPRSQSGSQTEGQGRRGSSGSKPRKKSVQEVPDHGPNARRESLRRSSMATSQSPYTRQQREETCAVTIQRNVRGTGRRKRFLTLQSAREDFEHHLQKLVSAAATALAQQQQNGGASDAGVGGGGSLQSVSAAAVRLLETGREDGLAKPPFDILRGMYSGMEEVAGALASLSAGEGAGAGAGAGGMMEYCRSAKEALDAIREAVGADIPGFGDRELLPSAASSPMAPRHNQSQPVGSGRAAAVAMASARGGLLVSPEDSSPTCLPQTFPLRTLDVHGVAELLRVNGFEEHAPGFVAQGIDGVMLSDPNLCEADFAELGLGGGGGGEGRDSRARIVSLFRRCQQEGAAFPVDGDSSRSAAGEMGRLSGDRCAGDANLDGRRREAEPSAGKRSLRSSEESSWRRGSALVDRENQRVLAQITVDPSETGSSGAASSRENENGRRMSVKLNNGVVVTAGGREEGLVGNTDETEPAAAEVAAAAANSEEEDEALAATLGGGVSSAVSHGRKASIGLRTIPLYKEPSRTEEGSNSHAREDLPLPPSVAITASDETVNVFR